MTLPKQRGFHRALGAYRAQNNGSGKLTRRQARRLRKHYPEEMAERARILSTNPQKYKDWY